MSKHVICQNLIIFFSLCGMLRVYYVPVMLFYLFFSRSCVCCVYTQNKTSPMRWTWKSLKITHFMYDDRRDVLWRHVFLIHNFVVWSRDRSWRYDTRYNSQNQNDTTKQPLIMASSINEYHNEGNVRYFLI